MMGLSNLEQDESLKRNLKNYKQHHVIAEYKGLSDKQKHKIKNSLEFIQFDLIDSLYFNLYKNPHNFGEEQQAKVRPQTKINLANLPEAGEFQEKLYGSGLGYISKGKLAAILIAGGKGKKIGLKSPKCLQTYNNELNKPILQVYMERLKSLAKYSVQQKGRKIGMTRSPIQVYILISEDEFPEVLNFQKQHEYFGIKGVIALPQENQPIIDFQGNIVQEDCETLATRPNGSGGFFQSQIRDDMMTQLKQQGVDYLNIMTMDDQDGGRIDPLHVGYAYQQEAELLQACSEINMKSELYKRHFSTFVKHKSDGAYDFQNHQETEKYFKEYGTSFDKIITAPTLNMLINVSFLGKAMHASRKLSRYKVLNTKIEIYDPTMGSHKMDMKDNTIYFDISVFNLLPLTKNIHFIKKDLNDIALYCSNSKSSSVYTQNYAKKIMRQKAVKQFKDLLNKDIDIGNDVDMEIPSDCYHNGDDLLEWVNERYGLKVTKKDTEVIRIYRGGSLLEKSMCDNESIMTNQLRQDDDASSYRKREEDNSSYRKRELDMEILQKSHLCQGNHEGDLSTDVK